MNLILKDEILKVIPQGWFNLEDWRAQRRVLLSNGRKSRHGKSRSHVAWMAGGGGDDAF